MPLERQDSAVNLARQTRRTSIFDFFQQLAPCDVVADNVIGSDVAAQYWCGTHGFMGLGLLASCEVVKKVVVIRWREWQVGSRERERSLSLQHHLTDN